MTRERPNRREAIRLMAALAAVAIPASTQDAPVEYFEGIVWYERRPGGSGARLFPGKLMVNRREEKVAYFSGYTNRFESPFDRIKSLTYEYGKRPTRLTEPVPEGQKPFHRGQKHWLVFQYQDKGGYFREEILELPKASMGEVLRALEYVTGLQVQRP